MNLKTESSWYELVDSSLPLTQGDIIEDCPLLSWADRELEFKLGDEDLVLKNFSAAFRCDVIVMTQAFDLENEKF